MTNTTGHYTNSHMVFNDTNCLTKGIFNTTTVNGLGHYDVFSRSGTLSANPSPFHAYKKNRTAGVVYSKRPGPYKPKGKTLAKLQLQVREQREEPSRIKDRPEYVETSYTPKKKGLSFTPTQQKKIRKYVEKNFVCAQPLCEENLQRMLEGKKPLKVLIGEGHSDEAGQKAMEQLLKFLEENQEANIDLLVEATTEIVVSNRSQGEIPCLHRETCVGIDDPKVPRADQASLCIMAIKVIQHFDPSKAAHILGKIYAPKDHDLSSLISQTIDDALVYAESFDEKKYPKPQRQAIAESVTNFLDLHTSCINHTLHYLEQRNDYLEGKLLNHPSPFLSYLGADHVRELDERGKLGASTVFLYTKYAAGYYVKKGEKTDL